MANGEDHWHDWNLSHWNDALVDVVFSRRPDTSPEIVRIDATTRLLASASKANTPDADTIRKCFLSAFPKRKSEFQKLFDASFQIQRWSSKSVDLPFFAQLYLTILVASADEDTFAIGNFRDRLQKLLGFARGNSNQ